METVQREDLPVPNRPNLVLIHSDQHRFDCLGVNGHPLLKTPHFDRLAAEGMNFTHAFPPSPVCVPARNCLLHGQWATQHRVITNYGSNAVPMADTDHLPTFTQVLRDAGYFLGHLGKWHVHPEKGPEAYGFHEHVPDRYGEWRGSAGLPPLPHGNGWFGELDPHVTPEQSRLAWSADQVVAMLEARQGSDPPFFVELDLSQPHLPNVVPEPYHSLYPPDAIAPWPSFPDPLCGKPYIQAQQRRTWELDGWTWDDWRPVVSRYLGEISLLDAQVGRLLDCLDRLGLADNTLFVYTTDHGDMCGGHGMIDKMYILYEDVVRVPLLMRWPAGIRPGSVCDAFVSHGLDLAATFCEAAGAVVPDTFSGQSLLPWMTGEGDVGRDMIVSTSEGNQFGLYSQRMVRDRRWKYVWNCTAEDELYDLETDPGELRNRATAPACADELGRLRYRLVAWMEETRDPLLNQWTRPQLLKGLKV